jgi:putative FmdB family regulatory protein
MPIYEYRCASCGFQNEYLQRVSDPLLTDCPDCGKSTFTKLVSAAGFQLKGNGWYVTDFKNKNSGSKPAAKSDADKPVETKSDDAKAAEPSCGTGACPACT